MTPTPVVRVAPFLTRDAARGGLTTRLGFPDASAETAREALRRALARSLGDPPLAWLKQVHGATVHHVDGPGFGGEGDALVTSVPDLVLLVTVADCCPVLLLDPAGRAHGVAHAGWRGVVAGVLPATVEALADVGAPASELRAWIGPAIGACCFEVGPEVATRFDASVCSVPAGGDRPHVDLKRAAHDSLVEAGLASARIEVCEDCTHCREDLYWSYRRDGGIAGRHLGFLGRSPTAAR